MTPPRRSPVLVRVITWLPVGGIERRLAAVAPRLKEMGWSPRILCIREEGPLAADLRDAGIPVDVVPAGSRLSPSGIRAVARYFHQHQASVVHTHMYRSNVPGTFAARLAAVPAIFGQIHNVDTWRTRRQQMMERLAASLRTATFAVSGAVQHNVVETLRLPIEKVPILYNGVDTEVFVPDADLGGRTRAELGIPGGKVVFLAAARLHPQKNHAGMIRAAEAALSRMEGRDLPLFLFVGDGPDREGVEARAAASPFATQFRFLGSRSDMKALYNAADVFLLSSFKEGFSNAVVEALACGRPCLVSDVGGNSEAITGESVGWVHGRGDEAALAGQIAEAAGMGRGALNAMSDDCRRRAEQFSLDAMVRKTSEFYASALGREPAGPGEAATP